MLDGSKWLARERILAIPQVSTLRMVPLMPRNGLWLVIQTTLSGGKTFILFEPPLLGWDVWCP